MVETSSDDYSKDLLEETDEEVLTLGHPLKYSDLIEVFTNMNMDAKKRILCEFFEVIKTNVAKGGLDKKNIDRLRYIERCKWSVGKL